MAVIWADFPSGAHGLYGTTASYMLNGIWAALEGFSPSVTIVADPDPLVGSAGYVLKTYAVSSGEQESRARFALPNPAATEGIGLHLWMDSLPPDNVSCPYISFRDAGNSVLFSVRILSNGSMEVRSTDRSTGTLLAATTGPVVTANAYNHIEIKGTSNATTGAVEIRVNGVTKVSATGLNTGTGPIAQIGLGSYGYHISTGCTPYWKDIVFWDTSGSYANDFLGSVSVFQLDLDGDVSLGGWTPSTGVTGYDLLDETPPNDADYIAADATPPAAASFTFGDLPIDVTSVTAVLPIIRAQKTDGGDCDLQTGLISGVSTQLQTNRPITTAFTYWWDVSHTDPATAAAWLPSAVDAATLQIDRTL